MHFNPVPHRHFKTLAAASALVLLTACGSSAQTPGTDEGGGSDDGSITFAAVPSEESTSLHSEYETVIKLIEQETGKTVKFQDVTDYAAVIEGQRAGKIDLAVYGPFSYLIAHDGGVPVEPIGSVVDSPDEEPGYNSRAFVPSGSSISDLSGFRERKSALLMQRPRRVSSIHLLGFWTPESTRRRM